MKVLLVGNPNTGKTTLFNTLTKSFEHAGNWHGVTVDVKKKQYKYKGKEFEVCDLPGIYSLDAYSKEEKIAADFIKKNPDSVVVCICDANNLQRNLALALELKEKTKNIVLAVNMAKEVKSLDAKKLEKAIGIKTIALDARKKKSTNSLKEALADFVIDNAIKKPIEAVFDINEFERKTKKTFENITAILNEIGYKRDGIYGESRADKVLLSKIGSFFIFIVVMAAVFFITFGPIGAFLSDKVNLAVKLVLDKIVALISKVIKSEAFLDFLGRGVFGGALTVVGFLPQIILMFMCLNFLEDIGYLSRVAFIFDPLFKKIGLTGRAAFSLLMGFGCTTTAVMTSRNLDNKKMQKRTGILLPFMSCSAKLPVFAVITSAFFATHKAIIVFSLYLFALVLMILVALIFKAADKSEEQETFLIEMPKYRVPSPSKVMKDAFSSAKNFLVRVGGAIVISSMVVFILSSFSFKFNYVGESVNESILASLASVLTPIFKPLGFSSRGAVIAIVVGFFAKEMVVSSLAIINNASMSSLASSLANPASSVCFSPLGAISFLVFVLLYTPCLSACLAMKKELGRKSMWLSILLQIAIAYIASFLVYNLANSIITKAYGMFAGLIIFVAILAIVVIQCLRKKKLKLKTAMLCDGCGKKCDRA